MHRSRLLFHRVAKFRNIFIYKVALTYVRATFWRCLAESNRCSRFCRPVPNRSAKAPFQFWDCKYRDFYLNYKFILRDFTPHIEEVLSGIRLRDGICLRSGHMAGSDGRGYGRYDRTGLLPKRLPKRRLPCQRPVSNCK